jgi:signal transduction histidine kinase
LRLPNDEGQWEIVDAAPDIDVFYRMRDEALMRPRVVATSHGRGLAFWLHDGAIVKDEGDDFEGWEHRGEAPRLAGALEATLAGRWPSFDGAGGQSLETDGALLHVAASYDYPVSFFPADATLVAAIEDAELYRGLDASHARIAVGLSIAVLFAFSLAIVLARSYRRSIDVLERGIDAIGRGEWTQLPKGTGNELSTTLVDSMNTAVQRAAVRAKERDVETWSVLLRNIAHEVNNTLAPIKSLAQGMEGRSAELIAEGANSLATFVGRCSELAKLPPPSLQRIDVSLLVRAAANMYAPLAAARNVSIVLDVAPAWAAADPAQMERVLLNLVKNAIEAARTEVKICVSVAEHVSIVIRDDGDGISDEAARKIGTPFFTTKPTGTGLGFTLARQIVQAHGGALALENAKVGAQATISVPHA